MRVILPPLGNDFVVSDGEGFLAGLRARRRRHHPALGKVYAAGSFRFFETYSIVAYIYLDADHRPVAGLRGWIAFLAAGTILFARGDSPSHRVGRVDAHLASPCASWLVVDQGRLL
jgi:hypothetical protein